ncbi:hypothetical protein QE152_g5871 [Popillia japonica]|uniref:Uncharacterized protein n=1 Tax=Popillia japonica TaxID=7064 RepID=A0AAW1MLM2_POPJA
MPVSFLDFYKFTSTLPLPQTTDNDRFLLLGRARIPSSISSYRLPAVAVCRNWYSVGKGDTSKTWSYRCFCSGFADPAAVSSSYEFVRYTVMFFREIVVAG